MGEGAEYLVKAGQKAQQAYANLEALDHYNRALDMCKRLGEVVEPATRMTIYAGKGAVHFLLSEFHASIEAHQRLLEVAQQRGDRNTAAEALYQIGFGFRRPMSSNRPWSSRIRRRRSLRSLAIRPFWRRASSSSPSSTL